MSESVSPPPPSEEFSRSPSPPAKKEPTEEAVLYLSLDQKHSTDQDIIDLLSPYGTVNATCLTTTYSELKLFIYAHIRYS